MCWDGESPHDILVKKETRVLVERAPRSAESGIPRGTHSTPSYESLSYAEIAAIDR